MLKYIHVPLRSLWSVVSDRGGVRQVVRCSVALQQRPQGLEGGVEGDADGGGGQHRHVSGHPLDGQGVDPLQGVQDP